MNYPKKPGFNLYQWQQCAYITCSVKTWFLKILSLAVAELSIFLAEGHNRGVRRGVRNLPAQQGAAQGDRREQQYPLDNNNNIL